MTEQTTEWLEPSGAHHIDLSHHEALSQFHRAALDYHAGLTTIETVRDQWKANGWAEVFSPECAREMMA